MAPTAAPPRERNLERHKRAHEAGRRGRQLPKDLREQSDNDPDIIDAYDAGVAGLSWDAFGHREREEDEEPDEEPEPAPPEPENQPDEEPDEDEEDEPAPSAKGAGDSVDTGAGIILGAVAYALLLALINYGPSGPKLWLKAKFLNQPAPAPGTTSASSSSSSAPATQEIAV